MSTFSRRTFLRGAGGVAIALPFLNAMGCATSQGGRQGSQSQALSTSPKRLIIFSSSNGSIMDGIASDGWRPAAGATETNFMLRPMMQPLLPHQGELIMLDGVGQLSGLAQGPQGVNPHAVTALHQLVARSAAVTGGGSYSADGGISIDQKIASVIGATTPQASLNLNYYRSFNNSSSADANGGFVGTLSPADAWNSALSLITGGGTTANPAAAQALAQNKSVLDAVQSDYTRLRAKLGQADAAKLDQHLAKVRDIETRLSASTNGSAMCTAPSNPSSIATSDAAGGATWLADTIPMTLACDTTRVVIFGTGANDYTFVDPRLSGVDPHLGLAHNGNNFPSATREQLMNKIDNWNMQILARLVTNLKNTPDGDGTLMDNTCILNVKDFSDAGDHMFADAQPFFLLAGKNFGLTTGRYIKYSAVQPHNNLFVSLLQMFGCNDANGKPLTTFGDPSFCTGALAGLA